MSAFTARVLSLPLHGGERLQAAREARRLRLSSVSRQLNVPLKYLEAIEAGEWHALPEGDYGRYFVRAYAEYLWLDPVPLIKDYAASRVQVIEPTHKVRPTVTHGTLNRPVAHPLRRILAGLVVAGILVYLGVATWRTFVPPKLTLVSPAADVTTSSSQLAVSGVTQAGALVTINGEEVEVNDNGRFNQAVALQPGLNTISVVVKKTYSRSSAIIRQVLFTPPTALAPAERI